jgi:hypothetical protein
MDLSTVLFGLVLVAAVVGLIMWTIEKSSKSKNAPVYIYPATPQVAFPFEPLTELVEDCANKFSVSPLPFKPPIRISPAHYFPKDEAAFYLPSTATIYVKDTFANAARPEELLHAVMMMLVHAWLYQRLQLQMTQPDDPVYLTAIKVAQMLLGLTGESISQEVHPVSESAST